MEDLHFVDCESSDLSKDYFYICGHNNNIKLSNSYFIRISLKFLISFSDSGVSSEALTISNCFKYSFLGLSDKSSSPISGNFDDSGNNAPIEIMNDLAVTFPFPHLAKVVNLSYTAFCPDMDLSYTFSISLKFSPSVKFASTIKFSSSKIFSPSVKFASSVNFSSSIKLSTSSSFSSSLTFSLSRFFPSACFQRLHNFFPLNH
jgi:hypothetical protein